MIAPLTAVLVSLQNAASVPPVAPDAPVVHVTRDNTVIDRTCSWSSTSGDHRGHRRQRRHPHRRGQHHGFACGESPRRGEFDDRWNVLIVPASVSMAARTQPSKAPVSAGAKSPSTNADGLTTTRNCPTISPSPGQQAWAELRGLARPRTRTTSGRALTTAPRCWWNVQIA
jgi:hypothetical protein